MTCDNIFLSIVNLLLDYYYVMNPGEAGMFLAIGFVPTLIALEMTYRMGRAIGKRGDSIVSTT